MYNNDNKKYNNDVCIIMNNKKSNTLNLVFKQIL